MRTHKQLVKHLEDTVLKTKNIIDAFNEVDRADFVQPSDPPYTDNPLPIGKGQTISQPTTVAMMLEWLQPKLQDKILDVGSGSGWTTALLAHIARKGKVMGVELVPELVKFGNKNLDKYKFANASIVQAKELGLPEEAPFDKILVSASTDRLPEKLVSQLKIGGKMVIPIQNSVFEIEKTKSGIKKTEHRGFVFVPLN